MWQTLGRQTGDAFLRLSDAILAGIPALLVLGAALLLGLAAGAAVRGLLTLLFRAGRTGKNGVVSNQLLRAAGVRSSPAEVAGAVSFWAAVVVALCLGVSALEPGALKNVLAEAVSFLPRLLTSLLLLVLGIGLGALARRSFLLAAVNAGAPWARSGARLVHVLVLAFFTAAALDQLGVGRSIIVAAFSILFGGFVLALALAFGLGGRDLARAYLEKGVRAGEEDTGIRHV